MTHLDLGSQTLSKPESTRPFNLYTRFGKRVVDLVLALILLPLIAPVILLICLAVRRDGASALFAHARVGQHGQAFKCWKIRTMVPNAQSLLLDHLDKNPKAAAEWARTQKLTHDPRVTPLGRFLRRASLDELPQVWNVLRGDMSFVGPRPVTQGELTRYGSLVQTYLSLKPGVTGNWQIHGRSDGCYVERIQLDAEYAQRVNVMRDLGLIVATVRVVVYPTGR